MKRTLILSVITLALVIIGSYPIQAVEPVTVDISVGVNEYVSLTLNPTSLSFGSHNPGDTSWYDTDDSNEDGWNTKDDKGTPDPSDDTDSAVVTATCINNKGLEWSLKVSATQLTNTTNSSITIPHYETYDTGTFARFGWTASKPTTALGDVNEHVYEGTSNMMPFLLTDEVVYTSGIDPDTSQHEGGSEVYIWTGIELPLSSLKGNYESTLTYTLTE